MLEVEESAENDAPADLLAPDEPAPFEVRNVTGRAPVILICDHASRYVPRALNNLGLDEAALRRHIAWDIGIGEVTRKLSDCLDAPAVLSGFSRLVIDPNRILGHAESIPAVSDGQVVPGNQNLSSRARAARTKAFFEPYHAAVEATLSAMDRPGFTPAVLSMHSFTPVMDSFERPWKIGILWNQDPRLPLPLIDKLRALGITVGDNEPYSGRDQHGYTQQVHADAHGFANALIEVRQDLIDTHRGIDAWVEILEGVIREVLREPALFIPPAAG